MEQRDQCVEGDSANAMLAGRGAMTLVQRRHGASTMQARTLAQRQERGQLCSNDVYDVSRATLQWSRSQHDWADDVRVWRVKMPGSAWTNKAIQSSKAISITAPANVDGALKERGSKAQVLQGLYCALKEQGSSSPRRFEGARPSEQSSSSPRLRGKAL